MPGAKGARSLRNTEKTKKKAASTVTRAKVTRNKGVTKGARTAGKKSAGLARARKTKA